MSQIKVVVNGALGRMGQQVVSAVVADPGLQLIGASDIKADGDYISVPGQAKKIPLHNSLTTLIEMYHPEVVVDFTVPDAAMGSARLALKNGANLVMGTTGLTEADLAEIDEIALKYNKGAVVAANFAIGAVILMHLAKIAAKYLDNAEIIELHHDKKLDAPSGTALATARGMLKARGKPFIFPGTEKETLKGTRGGQMEGIAIHSVRLPGPGGQPGSYLRRTGADIEHQARYYKQGKLYAGRDSCCKRGRQTSRPGSRIGHTSKFGRLIYEQRQ